MFRLIENQLIKWKNSPTRKPLIIRGARQIGKSWAVEHFGSEYYLNVHVINFEKRPEFNSVFDSNFDIARICLELELILGVGFDSKNDLLFFDEIQSCPKALMSLRYFYEERPDINIIAAGSLLDFVLKEISYPVGRVEHLDMHPLNFYEFLLAVNKPQLAEIITSEPIVLSDVVDGLIKIELNKYFLIGGMPQAVKTFVETNSIIEVIKIQEDLIYSIREDFKKYSPAINPDCLNDILRSVSQRIGSQIKYTNLSDRFSGPTIKKGFDLLKTARILHPIQNVSVAGIPLMPSGIQFKCNFLDIGLYLRIMGFPLRDEYSKGTLVASFKGSLAEQFVGQEFLASTHSNLNYWLNLDNGAISEVDYILLKNGEIIPIEVKAGKSGSLKSLHILMKKYSHIKNSIVLSESRHGIENNIQFLPLYWAGKVAMS